MKSNIYTKIALCTLILFLLDLIPLYKTETSLSVHYILWNLLADLIIVLLMVYYLFNTTLLGTKLVLSIFTIFFVIGTFNLLIEAYIFNVTTRSETGLQIFRGFIITLITTSIFVKVFNKWDGVNQSISFEKRSLLNWTWRIAVGVVLYLFFYLTAGFTLQAVYPELLDFYQDKLPPLDVMFGTQFFRGLVFVLITVLMLNTLSKTLREKAIYIALLFALLGGIAPLLAPNEFMPRYIRMGHMVEVGISNFLYGFTLAYLFGQKVVFLNNDN